MTVATVTKATRAGADGELILSPCCQGQRVVYHFAWDAITCPTCRGEVQKHSWLIA